MFNKYGLNINMSASIPNFRRSKHTYSNALHPVYLEILGKILNNKKRTFFRYTSPYTIEWRVM